MEEIEANAPAGRATAAPRRWQVELGDLVFAAVLIGVAGGIIFPGALALRHPGDPGLEYPSAGVKGMMAWRVEGVRGYAYATGVLAAVGAVLIFGVGNRRGWGRVKRWGVAGVWAVALASVGGGVVGARVLFERMLENQTAAVQACKSFCTAQDVYRRTDWNNDLTLEYAQTGSGRLGLADPEIMLIDRSMGAAFWGEGHSAAPKNGYVFKVLKGQGPNASGGRRTFMYNKTRMALGYAMVATPAVYGSSGKWTFLVSNAGTIYQVDYGVETPEVFRKMTLYDPPPYDPSRATDW